jgi:hypothetical protein
MKVNWSREVKFVPKWRGNDASTEGHLVAVLKPMTLKDVLFLQDSIQEAKRGDTLDNAALLKACGDYLPKYVTLQGAEDFTMEDVTQYAQFFDLAIELLMKVAEISQPNEADLKN